MCIIQTHKCGRVQVFLLAQYVTHPYDWKLSRLRFTVDEYQLHKAVKGSITQNTHAEYIHLSLLTTDGSLLIKK